MKKFSEQVLAPHKHMSKKASPHHAHSMGVVYTPKGKEEVRPIDSADAGYGGEAVADAEGGEANPGKASKKAVAPMKMQTLVKANEETERERLMKLRSFAAQQKNKGLGKTVVEEEQIDELKKSTLASYAKKATDDVSYHSFTAGTMSAKDPERLAQDKKAMKRQTGVIKAIDRLAKEEVELDERNMENKAKKDNVVRQVGTHAYIKHGTDAGSPKMTGRKVMKDPKMKSSKIADMYRKLPSMEEATNVTDYNPKSQGGTRVELLRKLAKSKSPEHATAARKAGATQGELKKAMTAEANEWNGPAEENDMAMTQLHFIVYAAEEIMHAIRIGTDMEEWYQNKLSKVHSDMESLHSYMEGTKRHHGTLGDPVAEAKADVRVSVHKDVQDFLKKGGKVKQLPPSKATHRPGTALASKMIGSRGQVPGLARNVGGKKPVVAVEEGKMKDIATDKAEDERLAAHAADMLGGPVKKKPEGPKGKLPLGFRLARSAAKKAMKSVSEEEKKSKVPRIGPMEKALEEEQIDELMGPDLRSQQAKENDAHFKKQPPRMQTAIRYHLKNRKSYKDAVSAAEKDVATMHEEVWDKPMPDSKKQGSLSPEQKAKARARAARAGRSYPNMIDNMWASKQ